MSLQRVWSPLVRHDLSHWMVEVVKPMPVSFQVMSQKINSLQKQYNNFPLLTLKCCCLPGKLVRRIRFVIFQFTRSTRFPPFFQARSLARSLNSRMLITFFRSEFRFCNGKATELKDATFWTKFLLSCAISPSVRVAVPSLRGKTFFFGGRVRLHVG